MAHLSNWDLLRPYIPLSKPALTQKSFKKLSVEFLNEQNTVNFTSNVLNFEFYDEHNLTETSSIFDNNDQIDALDTDKSYEILLQIQFYSEKSFDFEIIGSNIFGIRMKAEVLKDLIDKFLIFNFKPLQKGNYLVKLDLLWENKVHNKIDISLLKIVSLKR